MELSSRTSAFWLRWIPCIAFSIYRGWKAQFRSQQDWERPAAMHALAFNSTQVVQQY